LKGLDRNDRTFPIDETVVEGGIASALDHLTGKFGLLIEHMHGDIATFLDTVGLSLEKLRRAKAVADMAAVLL
jgi:hypothetical protein